METERLCYGDGVVAAAAASEAFCLMLQTALLAEKSLVSLMLLIGSLPKDADMFHNAIEEEKRFPISDLNKVTGPSEECKDGETEDDSDDDEDDGAGDDSDDDAEDSSGEENDDGEDPVSDSDADDNAGSDDDDDDDDDDEDDDDEDEDDEEDDDEEEENQPPFKKKK